MSDEIEVIDAEVVEATSVPAVRDAAGKLQPGHQMGRPKGSKGRLRDDLFAAFREFLGEHPDANPLTALGKLVINEAYDMEGKRIEVPLSIRKSAMTTLSQILYPPSLRMGDSINIDIDARRVEAIEGMMRDPQARGLAEMLARKFAARMPVQASGRLINLSENAPPRPQAAIEAAKP